MKTCMRFLSASFITVLLLNCCMVSRAAAPEKGIDISTYITARPESGMERIELRAEAFAEVKEEAKRKGCSPLQISESLLQALGVQQNDQLTQRLSEAIASAKSITCGIQYLQIDESGDAKALPKEECLKKIALEEKRETSQMARLKSFQESSRESIPQLKSSGEITGGEFTSSNQYMEMALIAVDQSTAASPGEYMLLGIAHWLKTPLTRKTDALTISATNFSWSPITNQDLDNYGSYFQYDEEIYVFGSRQTISQTKEFQKNAKEAHMDISKGFYFNWDLPKIYPSTQQSVKHSNLAFMIMGIGNFYDYDQNKPFNVQVMYTHIQTHLTGDITFSWGTPTNIDGDIGLPGAVASGNWTTNAKYYGMHLQVWHNPS